MDDVYAGELLRQNLIDACERENRLSSELQAAQKELQEWQRCAIGYKTKYQELDDLLEAEEAKTNAERIARQEAEESTRRHRAEILKLKRNETIANEHCEAAESEIISLQRDLSTERSATKAAGLLSHRLREDLKTAESNQTTAYDSLDAAKAKVRGLQQDLRTAADHISMLEHQAKGFEGALQTQHERLTEAEKTLRAVARELTSSELEYSHLLEKHKALEAEHSTCDCVPSMVATTSDTASLAVETPSPDGIQNGESSNSGHKSELVCVNSDRETKIKAMLSTARDGAVNRTGMPAFPKPAILRPAPAPATACQIETVGAAGRMLRVPKSNTRHLRWKFFCRLPADWLQRLGGPAGRVGGRRNVL